MEVPSGFLLRRSVRHWHDQTYSSQLQAATIDGTALSAWMSIVSKATVATIGLASKLFLNSGYCSSVKVYGIHNLLNELSRKDGQGVITVANHLSTLDDPIMWGVLPTATYFDSKTTRWSMGAADICFTNPVSSAFFRNGQVIETFRGKGIWQPAVDLAIEKVNGGGWVHLFGEGKVCQTLTYDSQNGVAQLRRFKWGVGRIVMEANSHPTVIPVWLTGFDQLMPGGRKFPFNYLPRAGADLSITFGEPIPAEELLDATNAKDSSADIIRSKLTDVVKKRVELLGRSVSGLLLGQTKAPRPL